MAGLRAGTDPQASTALALLAALLGIAAGATGRRLLAAGGAFAAAVLLASLVAGVLFYELGGMRLGGTSVAGPIDAGLVGALLFLAGRSAAHASRSLGGRAAGSIGPRGHRQAQGAPRRPLALPAAFFCLGALAVLLAPVCPDRTHLDIVATIAEPRSRAAASLRLLLYELGFVVPLVVVSMVAVLGLCSARAGRRGAAVKLVLALLFAGLAALALRKLLLHG
ncbi:MAG: hypothetical protein HY744_23580 [Deltaproteobacteria bacterium]|nr:hypothetical protein [Deltaproteobacteria bacterium]